MMRRLFVCTWLLTLPLAVYGEDRTGKLPKAPTNAAFEKMKSAGGHVAVRGFGRQARRSSRVDHQGERREAARCMKPSSPVSRRKWSRSTPFDGPDLVMTHYCVLGNQPRLKADTKSPADQIRFEFAGGANLDPSKDKHMHSATLTIVDDEPHRDRRGRLARRRACEGHVLRMKLVRKK